MDRIEVTLGGHEFSLLAGGGIFWLSQQTLLVCDTHFGKEASFRRASIAVPTGSTEATLAKLQAMIDHTNPSQVVFLGDLVHAKTSLSSDIRELLAAFWKRNDQCQFVLVRGNHDAAAGRLPTQWPLCDVGPRWRIENVALEHFPADPPDGCDLLFCGHLHPAVRLQHGNDKMGKVPCFWRSGKTVVLPALGDFTGTALITPSAEDCVWVTLENTVFLYKHQLAKRLLHRQRV